MSDAERPDSPAKEEQAPNSTASATTAPTTERQDWKPISFHGSGREYFGIWIVNLILNLITIGFYSPWATIRDRRYFYGHTEVAGGRFDFHGKGLQILIGRIIAVILLIGWTYGALLHNAIPFISIYIIVGLLPFFMVRGLNFRLRNTSLRNIRFDFDGEVKKAYKALWPYLCAFIVAASGFAYVANKMNEIVEDLEQMEVPTQVEEAEESEEASGTLELHFSQAQSGDEQAHESDEDVSPSSADSDCGEESHSDSSYNSEDYQDLSADEAAAESEEEPSFWEQMNEAIEQAEQDQQDEPESMKTLTKLMSYYGLTMMIFAFVFPVFICDVRSFLNNNSLYGRSRFSVELKRMRFFEHFWVAFGVSIAASMAVLMLVLILGLIAFAVVYLLNLSLEGGGTLSFGLFMAAFILIYGAIIAAYMAAYGYWRGRIFNDSFNSLQIEGIRFRSTLSIMAYMKMWVVNTVLMILSLGLAYPWLKVRLMRLQLESIEYQGDEESFNAHNQEDSHAIGDEVGEAFDFDFGF